MSKDNSSKKKMKVIMVKPLYDENNNYENTFLVTKVILWASFHV